MMGLALALAAGSGMCVLHVHLGCITRVHVTDEGLLHSTLHMKVLQWVGAATQSLAAVCRHSSHLALTWLVC